MDSTYGPWVYHIQLHVSLFIVIVVSWFGDKCVSCLSSDAVAFPRIGEPECIFGF